MNSQNNHQPVQVTASDVEFEKCICGSTSFLQAQRIGRLSAVHPKNKTGQVQYIPFPTVACVNCGEEKIIEMP